MSLPVEATPLEIGHANLGGLPSFPSSEVGNFPGAGGLGDITPSVAGFTSYNPGEVLGVTGSNAASNPIPDFLPSAGSADVPDPGAVTGSASTGTNEALPTTDNPLNLGNIVKSATGSSTGADWIQGLFSDLAVFFQRWALALLAMILIGGAAWAMMHEAGVVKMGPRQAAGRLRAA